MSGRGWPASRFISASAASAGGAVHRIDRHPVMSRHPVTPMDESDLCLHLGKQTGKTIALADMVTLCRDDVDAQIDRLLDGNAEVLLYDVPDPEVQRQVGHQLWRTRRPGGQFMVGSSGIEYALIQAWTESGMIPGTAEYASPGAAERIAVVSGSCSEITAGQIAWAERNGFVAIALDARDIADPQQSDRAKQAAVERGCEVLHQGKSVVFYTARGPESNLVAPEERS
ncbi:hypothetical protein GCM10022394_35210 [Zobellella aerophila]|uniref:Uncharacterized protein n=1 Tax=Zobellella aerophila TaxID=870480 RepID=A0ABP6WP08_9GAMM